MPVLKKVPSYVKNVAKSVAYSAVEVVKTDMPTVSAFLDNESNKEVGKAVYDNIKDLQSIRTLGRNTALALRRSKVWEAGELGIKSALEDIRTGKWYNKDRISMIEEQVLEETMGGWDDMELDMDNMEFGESTETTKGDRLVAASVQIAVGKSADQISETTINAASAIMSQQRKSTELLYSQNFKLSNELRATVTNIGNKTNVYLDNIQSINKTMAENNKKFFDITTKLMQQNNSMMKEMIEMQRNLYRNQQEIDKQKAKENSRKKPGYNDLVSMEGVLDFKEYGKYIKNNSFKVLDEQSGGALSMLFGGFDGSGGGNLLKTFAASPLSFISNMMIAQMIPGKVKKSTKKLDNTIAGIVPTLLGGLNKAGKNSDNPLTQIIGKIFGVDTRVKTSIDTSKYEKGPMQYNGKANKSLTEVIPELLSDILSTLSGTPKKLYDFDKGRWTTGRSIKREYDQMTKNNMKNSFSDLLGEMRSYMGGGKGPKFSNRNEADRFEQTLETFLTILYNNDGSFNSKKDYDLYEMAGVSKSDYDMISKMIQNIGKRNHSVRMGLSASVMSNKQSLNNQVKSLQDRGSIYSYLFNGTDANKMYKTPKYEESPIGIGMDLNKTLDNKGNNAFYYLQNIYDELYRIRTFGFGVSGQSGWKNGPTRGKPFNESIYDISRIQNNHKPGSKERYLNAERSKDARYQEMIEKFTREGGKLYDIADDKGNINLINATAEQRQIADMIEQARMSGGFLQNTLFGETSALDRSNAARSDKDESKINAKKFLDRLKQSKTLEDKFKVLSDQAKRGTRGTANVTANIITRADDAIYEFFFGDETGEEDENGKTVKGFMNLMKNKMNSALDKGLGFIDEKILSPMKKKTGADSLKDWFIEKTGLKGLFDGAKHWLLGDEGQKNGFLNALGEETKSLFSKAGGFVGNSFKTVFAPVTDKVKAGWQKMTTPTGPREVEVSPEEYLEAVRQGTVALDTSKSYSIGSIAMRLDEYGGRAKRLSHSLIMAPYNMDTIDAITSYLDGMNSRITNMNPAGKENIEKLVNDFSKYRRFNKKKIDELNSPSVLRRNIEAKRSLIQYKKDHPGYNDPNISLAEDYVTEENAERELANVSVLQQKGKGSTGQTYMDAVVKYNERLKRTADKIFTTLEISPNKGYYNSLITVLSEISPNDSRNSRMNIGKSSMSKIHQGLLNLGTHKSIALAEKIESYMINKVGNVDYSVGTILGNKVDNASDNLSTGSSINTSTNVMQIVSKEVQRIRVLLESIINTSFQAVKIVPARLRTNSTPLGGSINVIGSRNRESETEGRSSDSDDGGIINAAYGATFNKNSVSALSKDEIYGKNGLYGKIPKTGVYNVKSGTTVYPTEKNKAIELASEQDVINKAIYSNANAKGQATKQFNGNTYTEIEPGKWMAWVQDSKGRQKQLWLYDDEGLNINQRVKNTARSGVESVASGLGLNMNLGSMKMPKNLEEAKALVSKYAPKAGAGVILGGAVGLLAGNPILGAAIGGTASVIGVSEQAKTFLFGEKTQNAEGNDTGRTGGLISSGMQDSIKKYFPSMAKYGTVGATLGLLSPFGLVGGAMIGSTIGWANSNDNIREALFGKSDDPKSGLMSEETRKKLKKAMPNMIIGAGLGMLTGPFGILGNALLGSGLGLVSTTNGFKDFVFGTEYTNPDGSISREGGLIGSIRKHVVDPLKDFGKFFKTKMEDMFINGIINPIKESIKPLSKDFYLFAKRAFSMFPNMVNNMFSSTFGKPLTQMLDEKLIGPLSRVFSKAARGTVGLGTGLISAPFKAVRGIARNRQMSHIKTGNADYMTAADRLQFRKDHKVRAGMGDDYQSTDEIMNLMNKNQLKSSIDSMKVLQDVGKLKKDEKAAGRALSTEVTKYFGTKGSTWRNFKTAMESNNLDQFSQLLDVTPMSNGEMMSQAQKDALIHLANVKLQAVSNSRQKQNLTKDKERALFNELKQQGFNVNSKNVNKISALLQNEYNLKDKAEKKLSPEEQAAKDVTEGAKKNTDAIVKALQNSAEMIATVINNNAPDSERAKANAKFIKNYFKGNTTNTKTGETETRENRRQKELEEAQDRARNVFSRTAHKGKTWWGGIYDNAKQYSDSLDGSLEGSDESTPSGLAKILGIGINKKNKAASKINAIYSSGRKAFGEELGSVKKETKEVFDPAANTFRSFRRGMNGEWVQNSGKAQTTADKAETKAQNDQMNKLGLTIGSAIGKVFGSTDKETGEKKEGLLSKLFGKAKGVIGKIAKVAGMGLLGATVVAGVGQGAGVIVPKFSEMWDSKLKPWLNEKFSGFGDKLVSIKDTLVSLPGQFFNWMTGNTPTGGLPKLFTGKILPWYIEGFGKFAEYVVTPLTEVIIKTAPALIKGIGKGVWNAIQSLFHKKDKNTRPDYEKLKTENLSSPMFKSSGSTALSSIPTVPGGSNWAKQPTSSNVFDNAFNSLTNYADSETKDSEKEDVYDKNQAIINDPNSTPEQKKAAIAAQQNSAKFVGVDGKTYYEHNYMPKDSKGNTIRLDGTSSKDNANMLFNPLDGVSSLQDRLLKGTVRRVLTPGSGNGPLKLLSTAGKGISHLGVLGKAVGLPMQAAGNVGQAGLNTLDRLTSKVIKPGFVGRAAKSATGEAMEEGAKKGLLGKITKVIKEGISSIFNSKYVLKFAKEGMEQAGGEVTDQIVKESMQEASESIIKKLTKVAGERLVKAGAAVTAKISAAIASGMVTTVLFAAWDFGTGFYAARDILGLTKSQDVSWTERFIAGLLKCINGFILWGLIPVDQIVDVFVEYLAPKFGINVDDINARREASIEEVKQHNAKTGEDMTVEEYNNRNSLGTRIKKGASAAWSGIKKTGSNIATAAGNAWSNTKEVAGNLWSGVKKTGSNIATAAGNTWSNIKDVGSNVVTGIVDTGKSIINNISNGITSTISAVTGTIGNTKNAMDADRSAIKDLAQKGELKKMFDYTIEPDKTNPLGFIQSGIGFVNKLFQAPTAAFSALGNGIDKLLGGGKEDNVGMVSVSAVISEMSEYMDTNKHPDMSGWENIGSKYTKSTGVTSIINKVIVGAVKGIGKGVVNIVRSFGGIIDLINKIPGVNIGGGSTNGTGKYGLGRVSQIDPSVANVPFNTPGDSRKQTIGNSGCGPAAAVNAINYAYGTGSNDLINASKYAIRGGWKEKDGGTKPGFFTSYLGQNGLKASHIGNANVTKSLASGDPVILMGQDRNMSNTPYGPNPHYVVASGMDRNGNMIIDDPESMNPSSRYPAGKVLGKTSMAIKASRYGKGEGDYILVGVYKFGSQNPTTVSPLYISKSDVYTSFNRPKTEKCHPVMLKHDTKSMFYMKDSVLKKIGVLSGNDTYIPQGSALTSSYSTSIPKTNIMNTSQIINPYRSNLSSITQAEKNQVVFASLGWLDKSYINMMQSGDASATGLVSALFKKCNLIVPPADLNKTVRSILSGYFKINSISALASFAKDIGTYTDLTLSQLKSQNSSLYNKLNGYSTVNGSPLSTYSQDTVTVGSVCSNFGLRFSGFDGQISTSSTTASEANTNTYDSTLEQSVSSAYGTTTEKQSTNIFDMIKDSFVSLFNYTDKTGQTKNILDIFGIGSGSSSGYANSNTTTSAGTLNQATGVSGSMANNFPYYDQSDPAWGTKPYGNSGTISSSGCGPTSMAMVLKSFQNQLTPAETASWSVSHGFREPGNGTRWGFFKNIGNQYGLNTKEIDPSQSTMVNSLRGGFPVISSMRPGDFTTGGHFIVLSGLDSSGNILVNDPAGIKGKERTAKSWNPSTVASQSKRMWIFDKSGIGSIGKAGTSNTASLGNPAPTDIEANKQVIWKFLKGKGYSDIAVAGIMGNIEQECGFNYALTESGGKGPGVGICQWTYPSRKKAFLSFVPDWERNLPGQLDFLWKEINSSYKDVLPATLNKCGTVKEAVWAFHQSFEGSADIQRTGGLTNRENYGSKVYSQFANTSYGSTYATGKYGLGITDGQITSGFNDPTRMSHNGIDIASKQGSPVKSPVSGTVVRIDENDENGKMIVIRDDFGKLYTFTHLQSSNVRMNSRVAPNTIIGTVGSTGNSSGSHLHYQMTDTNGQFIDPVAYAMGKKTSPASNRAIGGSNGIDYTSLLNNVVQLLAIIGTNTEKINALVDAMGKMGIDTSKIDTTSNESKINAIKSSLSTGLNKAKQAQAATNEIEGQRLEKMTSIMRTIAAQ